MHTPTATVVGEATGCQDTAVAKRQSTGGARRSIRIHETALILRTRRTASTGDHVPLRERTNG